MPLVLATLLSATLHGITGRVVRVEVDVAPGLPGFTIVGLPDAALGGARAGSRRAEERRVPPPASSDHGQPCPAELRKAGASLDVAIALGILLGSEQLRAEPGRVGLIGELGLGGDVRPVPGILPMCIALARQGVTRVVVPVDAATEARLAPGIEPVEAETIADAAAAIRGRRSRRPVPGPAANRRSLGPPDGPGLAPCGLGAVCAGGPGGRCEGRRPPVARSRSPLPAVTRCC